MCGSTPATRRCLRYAFQYGKSSDYILNRRVLLFAANKQHNLELTDWRCFLKLWDSIFAVGTCAKFDTEDISLERLHRGACQASLRACSISSSHAFSVRQALGVHSSSEDISLGESCNKNHVRLLAPKHKYSTSHNVNHPSVLIIHITSQCRKDA